jgi:hypothetical protein
VPLYLEWIANGRKLDQVLKEWERLGLAAAHLSRHPPVLMTEET